jgi:hypothetical protein
MWSYRNIGALAVFFVVLVVGGCGGGASDSTGGGNAGASSDVSDASSTTPSGASATFIRQANNLCTRTIAKIQLQGKKVFGETSGPGEAPIFGRRLIHEVLIPNFNDEISGIRALGDPAAKTPEVEEILAAIKGIVEYLETHPHSEKFYPYRKAERLADAYGLTSCGRPALEEQ